MNNCALLWPVKARLHSNTMLPLLPLLQRYLSVFSALQDRRRNFLSSHARSVMILKTIKEMLLLQCLLVRAGAAHHLFYLCGRRATSRHDSKIDVCRATEYVPMNCKAFLSNRANFTTDKLNCAGRERILLTMLLAGAEQEGLLQSSTSMRQKCSTERRHSRGHCTGLRTNLLMLIQR